MLFLSILHSGVVVRGTGSVFTAEECVSFPENIPQVSAEYLFHTSSLWNRSSLLCLPQWLTAQPIWNVANIRERYTVICVYCLQLYSEHLFIQEFMPTHM